MILLHNLSPDHPENSNYNHPDDIKDKDNLTFDGIYKNVYKNRERLVGKNVILFVMGDYVGKDNKFDIEMPYEEYCDWNEIMEMVYAGAKLGWHTWSHKDLTTLTTKEKIKEILPPFPMEYFAYPYGRFDDECLQIVESLGYKEAFSVTEGDDSRFQRLRSYL